MDGGNIKRRELAMKILVNWFESASIEIVERTDYDFGHPNVDGLLQL